MIIVDLFSGAGGLTFGFYFKLINGEFVENKSNSFAFANEYDKNAAAAFKKNYPHIHMENCDIKDLKEEKIKELIKNKSVDLIIGGPPCQSFSTIGQRQFDDKAKLYIEYLRMIGIIKPKLFLFENVKGLLSMREVFYKRDSDGNIIYEYTNTENKTSKKPRKKPVVDHYGDKIMDIMEKQFKELGYTIYHKLFNAVEFGVPENRERVFIVGVRNDIKIDKELVSPKIKPFITIKEAISDLPIVGENEKKNKYVIEPHNDYQKLMRGKCREITQHYCGEYGDKIRTVIEHVRQGEGKNNFNDLVDAGEVAEIYRLTSGYANTYGRLIENQPSPTITNNMTTPSASRCIHYSQNRALTPREGARIQSFPDWYQFVGKKEHVTKQIGNAVPPLLSISLARQIEQMLEEDLDNE